MNLTIEQLQAPLDLELESLGRYSRTIRRMEQLGFAGDDDLLLRFVKVRDESVRLRMWLHYEIIERERRLKK
ncbi:hypothetical protein NA78x_001792 [Anatilimnocola sp. NA78]|uniref:hypothetical protein n=1 Tax=Anatilimnocola sp. NA78 TaxID=3415683 RepID=UPI003CE5563C